MATHLLLYLLLAPMVGLLSIVIAHLVSPLRSIPGPFLARFTKLWFLYKAWLGRSDKDNVALHKKYGTIVRYAPNHYSFSDPEAAKIIYGQGTEFDKSSWYEAWNAPGLKTLFNEPSVKAHAQLRKKFATTFSMSSMIDYEPYADQCIDLLKKRLEEIASGSGQADMAWWLLLYAGDTISMISCSERMGFLDAGEDVGGFFKTLHGHMKFSALMGIYAGLHAPFFNFIGLMSRLKLTKGTPRTSIARLTAEMIAKKRNERETAEKVKSKVGVDDEHPEDFLSKLIDLSDKDPAHFTDHDITVGVIGNVVAGADTTGATLASVLYCLLKHPVALTKLREEIAASVQANDLSSPPTFQQVHKMTYLQAVLHEAQRVYAQPGFLMQRVVPQSGREICGHHFPAGGVVGVSSSVMHLDKSIFGDDAAVFRPERWLNADKDKLALMNRYWMPFGLGSRTCIGGHISELEMTKLIPEMLRRFDFELDESLKGDDADWKWINYWLNRPETLPVKVRVRRD